MKKILLLNGHPNPKSFCNSIAKTYFDEAKKSGLDIVLVNIYDLKFDPVMHEGYRSGQVFEDDLKMIQKKILWCEHFVLVTPVWWGNVPAILKGIFDRVLTPGFAFKYIKGSWLPYPQKLLKGRNARVIYTQGSPWWASKFVLLENFWMAMKMSTLWFCGFSPVKRTYIDSIVSSSDRKRQKFLEKVGKLGGGGD